LWVGSLGLHILPGGKIVVWFLLGRWRGLLWVFYGVDCVAERWRAPVVLFLEFSWRRILCGLCRAAGSVLGG
ncbi:hypothetical protein, partial [Streptomyces ossamyceticus]|uniref:hypothetical protein n=1 Tax=Streptomyces ossamyceticus TaxID=249581 RepID=UPI003EBD01A4